ncbi:MAG: TIGR02444 family protein [Pseudomonadota bacterium]
MRSDNPFWDYSLAVYGKPGVAEACIALQDEHGVDVNILLFVCWLATVRDAPVEVDEIRRAIDQTAEWHDHVVRPLRSVRRWLKEGVDGVPAESAESLRGGVKKVELESERLQQELLYALSVSTTDVRADAVSTRQRVEQNISKYLNLLDIRDIAAVRDACAVVIAAAHIP